MRALLTATVLIALAGIAGGCTPAVRSFDPPGITTWRPEGCRAVGASAASVPASSHDRWTNLHSDAAGSDEVAVAIAPVLERRGVTPLPHLAPRIS